MGPQWFLDVSLTWVGKLRLEKRLILTQLENISNIDKDAVAEAIANQVVKIIDDLYDKYHEDRYRCSPLLREMASK